MKKSSRLLLSVVFGALIWPVLLEAADSPDGIWKSVERIPRTRGVGQRHDIQPNSFKAFTLENASMKAQLFRVPLEFSVTPGVERKTEITLPRPDGSFARFRIEEVAMMEPALAAKFPEIKTYRGRDLDDPLTTLQLDVNGKTLHAQVLSPSGAWYIDPYWQHDGSLYMSYAKSELSGNGRQFQCLVGSAKRQVQTDAALPVLDNAKSGKTLRTYRLACATSLSYSQYHGGTTVNVPDVMAALVRLQNRVSGVYENEFGIRMILVANEDQIISTPANPGPYSDTPGDIGTNPAYLDAKIGEANYDIGHVVTTGSGGVAGLGVVCRGFDATSGGSAKARGTTGINPPEGDGFWIDYVAHEMGHQFGGNHTFDGDDTTNCGPNQNAPTAFEPGSGTTIQAYAGICGNEDLQAHSDPYWHFISLVEMFGYATGGGAARAPGITLAKSASFGAPPYAPEATPTAGTLNPTGPNVSWTGTAAGGTAADESSCVEGVNCDTFTLTLGGLPAQWAGKTARVAVSWPSTLDDYDVFVHKGNVSGPVVASAASGGAGPEILNLDPTQSSIGTGAFAVRVVYFAVVPPAQQYTAVASVDDGSSVEPAPTCAVESATGNNPPTVDAGPDFKIPARTPFALTALNGTDPDGNPITYCWEEADLGPNPKKADDPDNGQDPIFRSYSPTTSPTRTFPRLAELLSNQNQTRGEKLPTTTRPLNFRVTVRDNKFGGFGMDGMHIDVIDSGTGFAVTSPNTAVSYNGGSNQVVTWDVANTAGAPISTSNVNIRLSTNGGQTYQYLLASNTANDGSESVTIPYLNSTTARIKVEAVGNIYFDISNANFAITSADTDGDGIPDGFESANGLNPNDPADAAQDLDGDGQSNYAEFIAGTLLNNPNSRLRIVDIVRPMNAATVTFTTEPNKRYQVEASPDLASWSVISGDIYPTGGTASFTDPRTPAPSSPQFYRARVFP